MSDHHALDISPRLPATGPEVWKPLLFCLGVPLLLALFSGTVGGGYAVLLGRDGALLYVCLLSLVPWWTVCLTSLLAKRLLEPWRPALWAVSALGAAISVPLLMPFHDWVTEIFRSSWPGGAQLPPRGFPQTLEHGSDMAFRAVRTGLIWIAVNYVFGRFMSFAPLAYPQAPAPPTPAATADGDIGFFKRARRVRTPEALIAIKAEEHYIRLYAAEGDELVHYPFSAAVAELDGRWGLQVHRSFWVARRAISNFEDTGGRCAVTLTNGLDVPVSRRYREVVRMALRNRGAPAPAAS